jgi:hypothetical protein
VRNYFNYFTEIEERFQQRRGTALLLSTLDWALIESWHEAGIPLEAALRGIDAAFDKYDAKKAKSRRGLQRINGLAWCSQAVMQAAMELNEAAIGSNPETAEAKESGFEHARVAVHLTEAAAALETATAAPDACRATAARLRELANEVTAANQAPAKSVDLETLERSLTVLEEKLFAALTAAAPEQLLVDLKEHAARELAPYRSRMGAVQMRQVEQQFVHKQLLVHYNLPRLSLFYMGQQ